MADIPESAGDVDTRIFMSSVLGMQFDGINRYTSSETGDLVQNAAVIKNIVEFFRERRARCELDAQSAKILEAISNAENEFAKSRSFGLKIQKVKPVLPKIPGFLRELKPYQVRSVAQAIGIAYAANFSVPGSGKTTIAYAAFGALRAKSVIEKIVVIGPRSSFMPWEEEYEACFGRKPRSLRVVGGKVADLEERAEDSELILLTYQMASSITNKVTDVLSKFNCLLVLDESHHVKRFEGGLWSESVLQLAPYAKRRLILTGTPMPNSLLDLWSQFTFLWPFKNLLGERPTYESLVRGQDGTTRVKDVIHPFYCRITKSELKLPPPSYRNIMVPLNRVQLAIYSALAARTLAEMADAPSDRMQLREWRRNKIVRLLQAASNPSLLTEYSEEFRIPPLQVAGLPVVRLIQYYSKFEIPSKLVEAERLTRELLDKGEKVIVWNTFIHNIKTLSKMLDDKDPIPIYGDIPKDDEEDELENREKSIREFKADTRPRVIIANPNSLAESVSLHKVCKNAIYVDRTFNAGQYIQSLDRIHRIGLLPHERVTYHMLVARGTIDEAVDSRLQDKYKRMLDILNDDLPIVEFDTTIDEVSDNELELDFQSVLRNLKKIRSGEQSD